jgi:hypothetical protein
MKEYFLPFLGFVEGTEFGVDWMDSWGSPITRKVNKESGDE